LGSPAKRGSPPHNFMTNRCDVCWIIFEAGYKINVCPGCEKDKIFGFPTLVETDSLHTMKNVSRARLRELDKRVMLPDTVKGKDYVTGKLERGKITDKQVDVRP